MLQCVGVGPSAGYNSGIGPRRHSIGIGIAPLPWHRAWTSWRAAVLTTGSVPVGQPAPALSQPFSLSIVLLSSSLFASKYTDLVPTRLLPGIGNVLDSTVQSPPLASTQTGTGPTPRFPDPTGITGTRIMFLPRGPRKQLGLLAKALLPPLQQVSQPMAQSCLFLRGTTSLWNSCMRGRRQ